MSFQDFLLNWHIVQICHLSASSFSDEINQEENVRLKHLDWKCTTYHSEWRAGQNAGGSGNPNHGILAFFTHILGESHSLSIIEFLLIMAAKFWTNPQFVFTFFEVDRDEGENEATVIVSLMQKDSRLKRLKSCGESSTEEYIQFRLYKVD